MQTEKRLMIKLAGVLGFVILAAGSAFGELFEVDYGGDNDWGGNGDDMGLNKVIECSFSGITSSIILEVSIEEGGYTDEKYSVVWSDGVNGTVDGERTKTAQGHFCSGDTPILYIYDGGTCNPPTNPVELGADITIDCSAQEEPIAVTEIRFDRDVMTPCDKCQATAVVEACSNVSYEIHWSVRGLPGCTISPDGWITTGGREGTLTVRAELASDPSIYAEDTIEVKKDCSSGVCSGFGGSSAAISSIDVFFNLGAALGGESAGYLRLKKEEPSLYWSSPAGLEYKLVRDDVVVLRDNFNELRQIKLPQGLVDLVATDQYEYCIDFYTNLFTSTNEAGFYLTNGAQALVSYRVTNPRRLPYIWAITNLLIVQRQGGVILTTSYNRISADMWRLSRANGLQIETLAMSQVADLRIATQTLADASGLVASCVESVYLTNTVWGDLLLKRTEDPKGVALCTSNTYDLASGRIIRQTYPGGGWKDWTFDGAGRITSESTPWGSNSVHTITNRYEDSGPRTDLPREVREYVDAIEIRHTEYTYSSNMVDRLVETISQYDQNGLVLATTNIYVDRNFGGWTAGKRVFTALPDGRTETTTFETGTVTVLDYPSGNYTFATTAGSAIRETITHGSKATPNGIAYQTLQEIRIYDVWGRIVCEEHRVFDGDEYLSMDWKMYAYDALGHHSATYLSDGTYEDSQWSLCCGKEWERDRKGIRTDYVYDELKRPISEMRNGITKSSAYDAAGHILHEVVSAGTFSMTNRSAYNLAGQLTNQIDQSGLITSWAYQQGGSTVTRTMPGGAVEVTATYPDGKIASVTGSAVNPVYYYYETGVAGEQWTYTHYGQPDGTLWAGRALDKLGREYIVQDPATGITTNHYDGRGLLTRVISAGLADTLYEYDDLGRLKAQGIDVNGNGMLDRGSTDRLSAYTHLFEMADEALWETESTIGYPFDGLETDVTNMVIRERRSGWADDLVAERESMNIHNGATITRVYLNAAITTETHTVTYPETTVEEREEYIGGLRVLRVNRWGATNWFQYDGLGRLTIQTESDVGTTVTEYDNQGRIHRVIDPTGAAISYGYDDETGRRIAQTNAIGAAEYSAFDARGNLTNRWGASGYPSAYVFDQVGRLASMTTWRDESGSGDTTTWAYDPATGLLIAKHYPDGHGPTYTYTANGRLASRVWARGASTLYGYDVLGQLTNIDYSGETPDVTFTYDRLGRQETIHDVQGAHTNAYNAFGELISETYGGTTLSRTYDNCGRPAGLSLDEDFANTYTYDDLGRFASISSSVASVSFVRQYSYLPNSDIITGFASDIGPSFSRIYETNRHLLLQVKHHIGAQTISQSDYVNDILGQRNRMTMNGEALPGALAGSYWDYTYDQRSQITGAVQRFAGGNPVPGWEYGYEYDQIGNRIHATVAGRTNLYAANLLNQYTQRTVQGWVQLSGLAATQAFVTVANSTVQRAGEFWHAERYFDNTATSVFASLQTVGVLLGGATNGLDIVSTSSGMVFLAHTPEEFAYDADGNLTHDGRWNYTWDDENRLVAVETKTNFIPNLTRVRLEFQYDHLSRRVAKKVLSEYSGGTYGVTNFSAFLWDGWNCIDEIKDGSTTNWMIWGLDLSGSLQGAGGIGGLLAVIQAGTPYYACADGNGNITDYIDTNGTVVAHRSYDPYGNTLALSGPKKDDFVHWFSSKDTDDDTGLIYYGYRFLAPELGRWLNRDPIGERGGLNLCGFVKNNSLRYIDKLGTILVYEDISGRNDLEVSMKGYVKQLQDSENKEVSDKINEMLNNRNECEIKLNYDSKAVLVGEWMGGVIDLADVEQHPDYGPKSKMLNVFHELVEQWEKQVNNMPRMTSHLEAIRWEEIASGYKYLKAVMPTWRWDKEMTIDTIWQRTIEETNSSGVITSTTKTRIIRVLIFQNGVKQVDVIDK